jgi:hypothetical protein
MVTFSAIEQETKQQKPPKSLFPLLTGLRTSQSTPISNRKKDKQQQLAQINFYKDDDETADKRNFIFATDAIVDHPLRIGVGYGSYICYSCTILSDKVGLGLGLLVCIAVPNYSV